MHKLQGPLRLHYTTPEFADMYSLQQSEKEKEGKKQSREGAFE